MIDPCEYLLFLDETGNHGMTNIEDNYPVFGLCGSLFRRSDYLDQAIPQANMFKLRFFRHEGVHFHSTAIRRAEGPFRILNVKSVRDEFLADLSRMMRTLRLTLFFAGMNKKNHSKRYVDPAHPYHYALELLLERLSHFCRELGIERLPIVAESRGTSEDKTLSLEFERILRSGTGYVSPEAFRRCGFSLEFASKSHNVIGLQVSDLLAYPIGRWIIDQKLTEPAEIALDKIHTVNGRKVGLKVVA